MKTRLHTSILAGATIALASAFGCNGGSPIGASEAAVVDCPASVTVENTDAGTPISFRNDVMPLFSFSCSFSSCHGTERPGRLYLGPGGGVTETTAAKVRTALLGPSEMSELSLVVPSRPDESFLMYKLDGDFCPIASRCFDGDCGESMPKGNPAIAAAKRDRIRQWISEGALDN